MEVEEQMDALPAERPAAAPEDAAVPLALCGPLGEGIRLGFGTLGCAFCSFVMFPHWCKKHSQVPLVGIWGQMFTNDEFYVETLYQKKPSKPQKELLRIDKFPSGLLKL